MSRSVVVNCPSPQWCCEQQHFPQETHRVAASILLRPYLILTTGCIICAFNTTSTPLYLILIIGCIITKSCLATFPSQRATFTEIAINSLHLASQTTFLLLSFACLVLRRLWGISHQYQSTVKHTCIPRIGSHVACWYVAKKHLCVKTPSTLYSMRHASDEHAHFVSYEARTWQTSVPRSESSQESYGLWRDMLERCLRT